MSERLFQSADDSSERETTNGYRAVSVAAVAAFFLGLFSIVALVHPLGWAVPALAVVAAWLGFRDAANVDSPRSGRRWAVVGLLLALFWLTAAPMRWFSVRSELRTRALVTAEAWFTAFQRNRPDVAFGLMRPPGKRPPLDTPLEKLLKDESFQRGYEQFLKRQLVALLLKHRDELVCSPVGHGEWKSDAFHDYIIVYFKIDAPAELAKTAPYLRLYLQRTIDPILKREGWHVIQFEAVPAPAE